MRKAIGCMLLLASVMAAFTVLASALVGQALTSTSSLNLPFDAAILLIAFAVYCIGMSLLSSIPSGLPRRSWLPWRHQHEQRR